jgi:carnitine O-acetyltransferase
VVIFITYYYPDRGQCFVLLWGYQKYRLLFLFSSTRPVGFDSVPKHLPQSAVSRAAGIARGAMIFRQQLKQGLIKPDTIRGTPLCMDTYR